MNTDATKTPYEHANMQGLCTWSGGEVAPDADWDTSGVVEMAVTNEGIA